MHSSGHSDEIVAIYRAARAGWEAAAMGAGVQDTVAYSDTAIAEVLGYPLNVVQAGLSFLGDDYLNVKPREGGRVDVVGVEADID